MPRSVMRLVMLVLALSVAGCVVAPAGGPPGYHWVPGHYDAFGGWHPGHWVP